MEQLAFCVARCKAPDSRECVLLSTPGSDVSVRFLRRAERRELPAPRAGELVRQLALCVARVTWEAARAVVRR